MTKLVALPADAAPTGDDLFYMIGAPGTVPVDRKVEADDVATSAPFASRYGAAVLAADPAFTGAFVAKGEPYINVRDYGAVGDGVTNDTAAFQAAINAIEAMAAFLRPALYVPQSTSRYRVTTLQVDFPGLVIFGAGREASQIDCIGSTIATYATSAGTCFNLGTFDNTLVAVEDGYDDTAANFTLRDLTIIDTQYNGIGNEGSRRKFAIQDNGGGALSLTRVTISGFAIGISLAYCSDFDVLNDVRIFYCDTAAYIGPLCNQFAFNEVHVLLCEEGIVVAGSPNGVFRSCWFIDSTLVDIAFEANTTTRSGVPQATLPNFGGNIEAENCWHESGVVTGRAPSAAHVWLYGDLDAEVPRNIKLRNPFVVAGGALDVGSAFCRIDNDDAVIEIDRPNCWGSRLDYWVEATSGNPTVILRDPTRDSTGASIENFTGTGTNAHSIYSTAGEEKWLSAQDFAIQQGTPSVTGAAASGTTSGWLLDAAAVEQVSMMTVVPPGWTTMAADFYWLNDGAGSGNVRLRLGLYTQAVGASTETALAATQVTYAAGAQDVMMQTAHVASVAVVPGVPINVLMLRKADDAADTLANDILFVGIMLRRLS